MKKHKILLAFFGAALVFASCKKSDIQPPVSQQMKSVTASGPQWKSLSNWAAQSEDKYTVYSNVVADSNITSSVASKGLVLAFKKTANSIVALPYDEKTSNGSYFWYYQISSSNIVFSAEAFDNAKQPSAELGFAYFIISPEKLNDLEAKGYSRAQLMKLSYDNVATLVK